MADKKISQLTGASTPLAGTEVLPIVQSGSTVKVSAADITAGRNISASGLTLSGGTANGVLYLNASKAASAGSVLTFDETTVNLAGSTRSFRSTADSGTAHTSLASDGVYAAGTDLYLFAPASKFVSFYSGGSEKLRLESSGNLVVSTAGKGIDFSANTHAAGMTSELLNWYEEGTWTPVVADASTGGNTGTFSGSATYTRIGRQVTVRMYISNINTTGMTAGNTLFIRGLPFAAADTSQGNFYTYRVGRDASTVSSCANIPGAGSFFNFALFTTNSATADKTILVSDIVSGTSEIQATITYFV